MSLVSGEATHYACHYGRTADRNSMRREFSQRLAVRTARSHTSCPLHASQWCTLLHPAFRPHITSFYLQASIFDQGGCSEVSCWRHAASGPPGTNSATAGVVRSTYLARRACEARKSTTPSLVVFILAPAKQERPLFRLANLAIIVFVKDGGFISDSFLGTDTLDYSSSVRVRAYSWLPEWTSTGSYFYGLGSSSSTRTRRARSLQAPLVLSGIEGRWRWLRLLVVPFLRGTSDDVPMFPVQ